MNFHCSFLAFIPIIDFGYLKSKTHEMHIGIYQIVFTTLFFKVIMIFFCLQKNTRCVSLPTLYVIWKDKFSSNYSLFFFSIS